MTRDKTQLLRLIFIDRKIREGMRTGVLANCATMAAEYEVSAKSILRDIDYLRNQRDAPIAYDPVRRGYRYTEENYSLPAISLNESDLFAICLAEKVLRMHEDTPIYSRLQKIFSKIEESLPEKISVQPSWVENRVSVIPEQQTRLVPQVWEAVSAALQENRTLRLCYRKPGAKRGAWRLIDPYRLIRYQGEWYLVAKCHRRKQVLTFAMSRIEECTPCPEIFSIPQDFDCSRHMGGQFGIFGGEREVAVRIWFSREHAPYVLEREWHPAQVVQENKDGSVELGFPARHLYEVKRWVLSWGRGARVLAPDVLGEAVREELAAALAGCAVPAGGCPCA